MNYIRYCKINRLFIACFCAYIQIKLFFIEIFNAKSFYPILGMEKRMPPVAPLPK